MATGNRSRGTCTFRKSSALRKENFMSCSSGEQIHEADWHDQADPVGLANIFGDALLTDQMLNFLDRKSVNRQPGFTRACRVVLMEARNLLARGCSARHCSRNFPNCSSVIKIHRLGDHGAESADRLRGGSVLAGSKWTPGLGMDCRPEHLCGFAVGAKQPVPKPADCKEV